MNQKNLNYEIETAIKRHASRINYSAYESKESQL